MSTDGGEDERLAPVIPLFGGAATQGASERSDAAPAEDDAEVQDWHTTWRDLGSRPDDRRPTAVKPLQVTPSPDGPRFVELPEDDGDETDADELREQAEARLVKALRRRSLSVSEARAQLRESELDAAVIDEMVDRLVRLGALDDDALADQLVYAGVERKNQGRRAIAQALSARGIDREAIERALAELPDDDFERALEYARGKATSLLRYDDQTALRRLSGQLARRGYGGGLAMSAARAALDEARRPRSGVRFD
ncbi:regulatory protein RecX [Microbacterium paludicola]|uniref:Regulatory protein RecX n=1 Tax=Microbacterium paludicola TaxID=300019 RepID=A0A4Y9FTJ9_9MICO|nr:regulatory protein RecX [Microbacterium paludicola]MBF0816780.1 regulatory protein RecX [Microbacterium paludicola]TFU32560.1 regulatory protein RecX [Microbacterium paludicola]